MRVTASKDDLPAELPHPAGPGPEREYQALWFALATRHLASVVLVPADDEMDLSAVASAMADVGKRLGDTPVTAIAAGAIDYEFVARTAALLTATKRRGDRRPGTSPLEVIVAIHPVTVEPLGLALVQAADAAILCLTKGRTRLAAARKTVSLIGRERFAGSIFVG